LYPQNIGGNLYIDETALSYDELYTIITNKKAKGKAGSIVAIIKGTKADTVIEILNKIPLKIRNKIKEITLDMAPNMKLIVKKSFPNATLVTDRFHVQKLAIASLQEIRIKHRWEAIDQENQAIEKAKQHKKKFNPTVLEMVNLKNNSFLEADICFIKEKINGLKTKKKELEFYSIFILI
jgi:transposase